MLVHTVGLNFPCGPIEPRMKKKSILMQRVNFYKLLAIYAKKNCLRQFISEDMLKINIRNPIIPSITRSHSVVMNVAKPSR